VHAFAKHNPAHIYFSGRNASRAQSLIDEVKKITPSANLTFIELDLSSLSSIKNSIPKFTHSTLDIFMGNAGIMAKLPQLSKDGYEIQFATNHLGHALLIKHLLPIMLKTAERPGADVRIVLNTSTGWRGHPKGGIRFDALKTTQDGVGGPWIRYGQSKFANLVYAAELARRYPQITSASVHPGVIFTGLVGDLSFKNKMIVYMTTVGRTVTPEEGVLNQLWVAASGKKKDITNGAFYMPVGVESNSMLDKDARNEEIAKKLWEWTEEALDGY
jgi:NAD(P)-dependent dehydrogenase (short-subunit alcohol dehydrogenase family)